MRNGGQKARRTGENAKQPFHPSRGECRDVSAEPVVPAACIFFCRRAMGAASARHSPCPLFKRVTIWQNSDAGSAPRDRQPLRRHEARHRSMHGKLMPRITIIETGVLTPDYRERHGSFPEMFERLIGAEDATIGFD